MITTLCYLEKENKYLMLHRTKKENDINKNKWLGVGGKLEKGETPEQCLIREVKEESGIQTVKPITEGIYSLETIEVNGHEKNGKYVPSHLHLNVTYLLEADDTESLHVKQDENSAVNWFPIDQVLDVIDEPWMVERIYKKLNQKLKEGNYAS